MKTTAPKRVLLSPVGGQAIHGIVGYFKEKGYEVIGIDRNREAVGGHFVDRFYRVPDVGGQEYMKAVLSIIRENKISLFISWLDSEVLFWNDKYYSLQIPEDLKDVFMFNFRKDLTGFCDKYDFHSLLRKNRFNCPEVFLLNDRVNVKKIHYPIIIKPRMGQGAKRITIIEGSQAFEYFRNMYISKFGKANEFIAQKYLNGIEYTIDFFSEYGACRNSVIRKRLESDGVSLRGEVVHDRQLDALVNRFCSVFLIHGLNNIQVIKSQGNLYILEYNPRPSGTIAFSIKAGVDLLHNLIEQKCCKKATRYGRPKKLKMVRYLSELYYE